MGGVANLCWARTNWRYQALPNPSLWCGVCHSVTSLLLCSFSCGAGKEQAKTLQRKEERGPTCRAIMQGSMKMCPCPSSAALSWVLTDLALDAEVMGRGAHLWSCSLLPAGPLHSIPQSTFLMR